MTRAELKRIEYTHPIVFFIDRSDDEKIAAEERPPRLCVGRLLTVYNSGNLQIRCMSGGWQGGDTMERYEDVFLNEKEVWEDYIAKMEKHIKKEKDWLERAKINLKECSMYVREETK